MRPQLSEETIHIVQRFVEEIAHQIRNPLGSIELFASLLLRDHQRELDRQRLEQIIAAVRLIDRRLSEFMVTSKNLRIPVEAINLNELMGEIVGFAERMEEKERPYFQVRYGEKPPLVRGNREMLRHLLISLIFQILLTITEEGHLRVEIFPGGSTPADSKDVVQVILTVVDTNTSFSPLDLFFPKEQKSVGLGFSVLFSIIDFHGGSLSLREGDMGEISLALFFPPYDELQNEHMADALQVGS
ncbi:MAG: hypothetical protein N2Z74_02215 [Syntrophales bacterium]|nr:hypothetical protein [Syntrophales bacterium]